MRHKNTTRRYSSRINRRFNFDLQPGPRAATVTAILNYSKALIVVDAPPLGKIDVVLN